MKRSLLLLLIFLSSLVGSLVFAASYLKKDGISEHFYTNLISEKESYFTAYFAPPVNDNCAQASTIVVAPTVDCVATTKVNLNEALTSSNAIGTCAPAAGPATANDVWYKFTATGSKQKFTITNFIASSPNKPVGMIIYRTKAITGTDVFGCASTTTTKPFGASGSLFDCSKSFSTNTSFDLLNFKKGEEYYIRFYTNGASTSTFDLCITTPFGPLYISPVDETFNATELIKDIFIQTDGCDLVSNVKTKNSAGLPQYAHLKQLGYFSRNGANFPFEEGIVLSTTEVKYSVGPYNGYNGPNGGRGLDGDRWAGDKDLNDAIAAGGGNPAYQKFRSTEVEFEFRPVKDKISFEYLFASNSYHTSCGEMSECRNGAMFAAWLIDDQGNGQNVAIVAGTQNAISIKTVLDVAKNGSTKCTSSDPGNFDRYYCLPNSTTLAPDAPDAPIDYVGLTKPMKSAEVTVVPGKKYRIKLAVLDFCGTPSHNSAVFFNAGSFDIGKPSLGESMTIADGNAVCAGETVTIGNDIDPAYYNISWYKNNSSSPIPGENKGTLKVSTPGYYKAVLGYKDIPGCETVVGPIKVEFYDNIDIKKDPTNIKVCIAAGNSTLVDLSKAMNGVTFSDVEYSYFETKADAEIGTDGGGSFIDSLYDLDNTVKKKTIWVRIQLVGKPCYEVRSFEVELEDCKVPVASLPDMHTCAVNGPVDYTFDLSIYDSKAGYGIAGVQVSYYLTETSAKAKVNQIPNPATHTTDKKQTIWVRVENATDYAVTSFDLYINPLPELNANLTPYVICKDSSAATGEFILKTKDSEITRSNSGYSVSYHETIQDAEDDTAALNRNSYVSGSKTIYYRLVDQRTGCFVIGTLFLNFSNSIALNGVTDFSTCSVGGYGDFNLTEIAAAVINGNVDVVDYSFHTSLVDAQYAVNPITKNIYRNVIPGLQTIYFRANGGTSDCNAIIAVKLHVSKQPKANLPKPIEVCRNAFGGVDDVNLVAAVEAEIIAGLVASQINVSYYTTYDAAFIASSAGRIPDPTSFNPGARTDFYVRVENKDNPECFTVVDGDIKVNELPQFIQPKDYLLCDETEGNGFATFVLNTKKTEIDPTGYLKITFYASETDARAGINSLNETSFKNTTAYLQQIWFRVESPVTKCSSIGSMKLSVHDYPVFDMTKGGIVTTCSSGNQGVFNITAVTNSAIDNPTKYEIYYYENKVDAELKSENRIRNSDAYVNSVLVNPKVYMRVESVETGCVAIFEIKLVINRIPADVASLPLGVFCDNLGFAHDGLAKLDLTYNETAILAGVAVGHTGKVTYYLTADNAAANINAIADPKNYLNKAEEETIYYRVTDETTGCFNTGEFKFKVSPGIKLIEPVELVKCSDLTLGQNKAKFDLTSNNNAIIDNIIDYGIDFKYYKSEADARAQINAIPQNQVKSFVNDTPIQNIWVVVIGDTGCPSIVMQTIKAEAMPEPNKNPKALKSCEGDTANEATFDLREANFNITGGDLNMEVTYFATLADAEGELNPIANTAMLPSVSKTIYGRVVNVNSMATPKCFVIVAIKLEVVAKPAIKAGLNYTYCLTEDPLPLNKVFTLNTKNEEILDGRNADNFIISYHKSAADATLNSAKLANVYTNETNTRQVIFVRLEDKTTGCVNIGQMVLSIEKTITATKPAEGIINCNDSSVNDGKTLFDLTTKSAEIIGTQTGVVLTYYASQADYEANNPIVDPSKYENTRNPQTIIAVVTNAVGGTFCKASTTFEIRVQAIPEKPSIVSNGSLVEAFVCFNQDTDSLTPVLIDTGLSATDYDFRWYRSGAVLNGVNTSYISVTEAGNYTVEVRYKNAVREGCYSTRSNSINVTIGGPIDVVIKGQDSTGMIGTLDENSDGSVNIIIEQPIDIYGTDGTLIKGYEFALNDGIFQDSRIFYNVPNGTHRIWVRETKGAGKECPQYKEVFILGYPKYFTPNGDGFNDTWNIPALKGHPEAVIYIYDRYGKLIKQLSPKDSGWDGTFNGKNMPSTDYWFTVEYQADGLPSKKVSFKGHFSLKR